MAGLGRSDLLYGGTNTEEGCIVPMPKWNRRRWIITIIVFALPGCALIVFAPWVVVGNVVDELGNPIERALVTVTLGIGPERSVRTGAKGDFLVTIGLSNYSAEDEGDCCITVAKRGYRTCWSPQGVRSWGPEFTRITIKLRKNNPDILEKDDISGWADGDINKALINVSGSSFLDVMERLLKRGADVNAKCDDGTTALIQACSVERGNIEAVEMLLERGPDLNVMNERGETALWEASLNGHLDIVKLLVEKGADLNARARDGLTALGRALKSGHGDIVKFLKAHGAKE